MREMLARNRFPHAVILSGSQGSGKYTLALMLAQTMNCLQQPADKDGLPDFCGSCSNCIRIAQARDLDARFAEAVEARENMRLSLIHIFRAHETDSYLVCRLLL